MTVEELAHYDNFPVGMRVLAVDDDVMCLKVLEGLLRKCQYTVTVTTRAREALQMIRDNRERFDLIISDVHMPDIDGFKLMELVGLEMDLPVIMLSANSDPKLVMKGVTHGACDYLVKPVRLEELRNVWQHVIRKKVDPKLVKALINGVPLPGGGDVGGVPCPAGSGDQNGKPNKRRKDEDDEGSENDEEAGAQKKPRVVWSIELHRKFVNAVHQLGIDKAVPKRILDLMNVEGLTRENVASHLQKYRLYLRRISSSEIQQANLAAALGVKDAGYMRLNTMDGLGEFPSLTGAGSLAGPNYSPFTQSGMLGRLNSPGGINHFAANHHTSSPLVRPTQNISGPGNLIGKLHHGVSPPTAFPPSSLEFNRLQPNSFGSLDDSRLFGGAGSFSSNTNSILTGASNNMLVRPLNNMLTSCSNGLSNNMFTGVPNNGMALQGNSTQALSGGLFGDHSNVGLSTFHSEPFDRNPTLQLSNFHLNGSPPTDSFGQGGQVLLNGSRPQLHNRFPSFSSTGSSGGLEDIKGDTQGSNSVHLNLNQVSSWNNKENLAQNNMFSNFTSQAATNGIAGTSPLLSQVLEASGINDGAIDVRSSMGPTPPTFMQQNEAVEVTNPGTNDSVAPAPTFMQQNEVENQLDQLDQLKPPTDFPPTSFSFDELMMSSMKREEEEGSLFEDGIDGFDGYPFGSGM